MRGATAVHIAALAVAMLAGLAACSPAPTPSPSGAPSQATLVETPWPNGTVGRYGLRVDPALMKLLPSSVGGLPIVEAPDYERPALDDQATAQSAESIAAARAGMVGDPDWVAASVVRFRDGVLAGDFLRRWTSDYVAAACSQAGGVASTGSEDVNDRTVSTAACAGGVQTYVVQVDARTVVAATDLGSRRLGQELMGRLP